MKKIMCILGCIFALAMAEELQLYEPSADTQTPLDKQLEQQAQEAKDKPGVRVGKNFSVGTNVFAHDGYSEMELETGKANTNEIDSSLSRYGAGVELNYSAKPDSRVEIELFASNSVEINTQRRGGKIKTYDTVQRYEENTYNYGNKIVSSPMWVNSIGMAITILKTHRVVFTLKQTQLSLNDALLMQDGRFGGAAMQNGGATPVVGNVVSVNTNANANPYMLTTQVFLTYSYVF